MWGVVTIVFFLFNILPGDPARVMVGQSATKEQIDAIHRDIGSDKPIMVQYLLYLNDISPFSILNVIPANTCLERFWGYEKLTF